MKTSVDLGAGIAHTDAQGWARLLTQRPTSILGCIGFGIDASIVHASRKPGGAAGFRTVPHDPRLEVFLSDRPVQTSYYRDVQVACNGEVLFAWTDFDASDAAQFAARGYEHYRNLLAALDQHGYPHLLRMWHYIASIHSEADALERYKAFSVLRHDAFVSSGRVVARDAPAASGVGNPNGPTVYAVLAARRPGIALENPRQVSAYQYPPQYGPRGPSFARALAATWGGVEQLYISGTASIVGHESRHRGDVRRQTQETLINLQTLFAEASRRGLPDAATSDKLLFKVYLRNAATHAEVYDLLTNEFGDNADVFFVEAEICRRELLVEIEAVALRKRAP